MKEKKRSKNNVGRKKEREEKKKGVPKNIFLSRLTP
jgi:hypothetical protein